MERKKIKNIRQIWNGKKLLIKNFSNLDLEGIDLSKIPVKFWKNCIFNNTNFKNTGIKFRPFELKKTYGKYGKEIYMCDCDFSDNDLSYLNATSFRYSDGYVNIDGCTFKNVNINFLFVGNLNNVTLDESFSKFGFDEFDRTNVDLATIKNNPFLNIPSYKIAMLLYDYINQNKEDLKNDKEKLVRNLEDILNFDKQGDYKKFYDLLKENFSLEDKLDFFKRKIRGKYLKDLDFTDIPVLILDMFDFEDNVFDNVVINKPINELATSFPYYDDEITKNNYKLLKLPNIKYNSWQEKEGSKKRISNSELTFLTKVYVELSRYCNGKCKFCRNYSFGKCKYDFKKIKETLNNIKSYVNIVVIGGGEPTLRLSDAKALRECFENLSELDFHMFTNGSAPNIINDRYVMERFKINLSRHAIDDIKNAKIFGISPINMMTTQDIEKLASKNPDLTLNGTCFKGGLDNLYDIVLYIKFAKEIGVKKVLLTNLHKDMSMGNNEVYEQSLNIDDSVFEEVINYLKENDFISKYPIYATGGYVSYIFKDKDDFSVTVQSYLTKDKLDNAWVSAVKRAFDLSIDPAGNLYENWHQQSAPVKSIGGKK